MYLQYKPFSMIPSGRTQHILLVIYLYVCLYITQGLQIDHVCQYHKVILLTRHLNIMYRRRGVASEPKSSQVRVREMSAERRSKRQAGKLEQLLQLSILSVFCCYISPIEPYLSPT